MPAEFGFKRNGCGYCALTSIANGPLLKLSGNPVLIPVTAEESVRVGTSSGNDFLDDVGLGVCIVLDVRPLT